MPQTDDEYAKAESQFYALHELRVRQMDTLDKNLLLLSGGAFGLSLTMLPLAKNGHPSSLSVYFMICAWSILALSIITIIASFFISQSLAEKEIIRISKCIQQGVSIYKEPDGSEETPVMLSLVSIVFFSSGVVLLLAFGISMYIGG